MPDEKIDLSRRTFYKATFSDGSVRFVDQDIMFVAVEDE